MYFDCLLNSGKSNLFKSPLPWIYFKQTKCCNYATRAENNATRSQKVLFFFILQFYEKIVLKIKIVIENRVDLHNRKTEKHKITNYVTKYIIFVAIWLKIKFTTQSFINI